MILLLAALPATRYAPQKLTVGTEPTHAPANTIGTALGSEPVACSVPPTMQLPPLVIAPTEALPVTMISEAETRLPVKHMTQQCMIRAVYSQCNAT